jgi:hypothetical protein
MIGFAKNIAEQNVQLELAGSAKRWLEMARRTWTSLPWLIGFLV